MINVVWWRLAWSLIRKLNWSKKNLEEETGLLIPFGENQESGDKELNFVFFILYFWRKSRIKRRGTDQSGISSSEAGERIHFQLEANANLKLKKKHCLSFFVSKYHSISFLLSYMEEEIFFVLFPKWTSLRIFSHVLYLYLAAYFMFCILHFQ